MMNTLFRLSISDAIYSNVGHQLLGYIGLLLMVEILARESVTHHDMKEPLGRSGLPSSPHEILSSQNPNEIPNGSERATSTSASAQPHVRRTTSPFSFGSTITASSSVMHE